MSSLKQKNTQTAAQQEDVSADTFLMSFSKLQTLLRNNLGEKIQKSVAYIIKTKLDFNL